MICQNCQASAKMNIQPQGTELEGVVKVWCPTWFTAENGPILICVEHALTFTEFNEHNRNPDLFHFGQQAQDRFDAVTIITTNDDRYMNVKGMLQNGTLVHGEIPKSWKTACHDDAIVVVDGKAWYICQWHAINLGNYSEAKHERFPALFKKWDK